MLVRKAYRYRLEPTPEQRELFEEWSNHLRFVWNWFLMQREALYQASEVGHKTRTNMYAQKRQLVPMKQMFPWLAEVPSQALQAVVERLDTAYQRFFAGVAGHPSKKKKYKDQMSLLFPQGFDLNGQCVELPKLGWVKCRFSRPVVGTIKSMTVSKAGRHWYVSILTEREVAIPVHQHRDQSIGIDVGVEESLALSDGYFIRLRTPKPVEALRLKQHQQRVSRCVRGSNRHRRALARYNRYRLRLADRFRDSQHKATTAITKSHGIVAVEDLRLRNMTASARGTVESPGTERSPEIWAEPVPASAGYR